MNLDPSEYSQYGRQMIVPQIGLEGQVRLKYSSAIVVGAGGLGSPALAYLVGAGVGKIGIVDGDRVEISNLHRQIIHSRATVGMPKCESAAMYAKELNPNVEIRTYFTPLTSSNAASICEDYSVILDCTDSPMSRYLVNDTAVILGIPLVSASALKSEGQLAVYNYKEGPCYRCIFPVPPPANSVGACSDAGIIGPVVGIMGVMQSIEAIKIIACPDLEFTPSLLIFSALSFPPWRAMKIRNRKLGCAVCGSAPTITRANLESIDYADFCGSASNCRLEPRFRLQPDFEGPPGKVLDVRPAVQFGICKIPGSVNIPITELRKANCDLGVIGTTDVDVNGASERVIVVCRFGNDSQEAVKILRERGYDAVDIVGGLSKWGVHFGLPEY